MVIGRTMWKTDLGILLKVNLQVELPSPLNKRAQLTRRGALSAALVGWGYWTSTRTPLAAEQQFVLPGFPSRSQDTLPHYANRWIEHESPLGFVHCASLSESANGDLCCTWYGGSREGARDVCVWLSQLHRSSSAESTWSAPVAIMDYQRAQQGSQQFIKKVGNALVFHDNADRMWMVFVSIALGGWSTSSLNATYSTDGGTTWSPCQRLWLSPMLNLSELVRCPPVMMSSGEIGVPIYHECAGVFPEMLWLRVDQRKLEYRKSRLCGGRQWLQPSVVPTGPQSAICYLRCANPSRRVGYQLTLDAGESWNSPELLELPNPNSAVCGVLMSDSGVLLALNNSADKRDSLSLAYSANGISDWKIVATLDEVPEQKFSYPTIFRDRSGMIHLVYSWKMEKLRHVSFNDAWVYQQLNLTHDTAQRFPAVHGYAEGG